MNKIKKNVWFVVGIFCLAACVLTPVACDIEGMNLSKGTSEKITNIERYAAAYQEVDFFERALPMVFGPSANAGNNSITLGGYPTNPSSGQDQVPEGMVELRSIGDSGKVAGNEDGITFYFKRVASDKNFIMEADFIIKQFGESTKTGADAGQLDDDTMSIHGQHSFGIMARDHVPQWDPPPSATSNVLFEKLEAGINLISRSSTNYWQGNRGGDSNMIMVGGVKSGIRAYWRTGVKKAPGNTLKNAITGEIGDIESGNPAKNEYQDASQCQFSWWPRESGAIDANNDGVFILTERPDFPIWGTTYKFRLEKTNNGFIYTITPPTEKGNSITGRVPLADILDSINKEEYYVGFFAGRSARVWINKETVKYYEANAEECEPYVPLQPEKLDATFEVVSPPYFTGENYIYAKSNVPGEIVVVQNGKQIPNEVIYSEWVVEPTNASGVSHNLFTIPTWDFKDGDNVFVLTFYPNRNLPKDIAEMGESGQVLNSAASIKKSFSVNKKIYNGGTGDMYVSNTGNSRNSGDSGSPLDLQTAINYVQPGQKIIVKDGTYTMSGPIVIPRYNNGRYGAEKIITVEPPSHPRQLYTLPASDTSPRYKVAFDFAKDPNLPKMDGGFTLAGNYWIVEGFAIENTPDKTQGMIVSGHNNVVSWVTVHSSGDTGLQISGSASEPKRYWPSGNTIEYCESFNNRDEADTDADGFAAKLTVGANNQFLWCISHNNCNDGWDLFTKKETGAIGVVKFFGCVSYENKRLLNGNGGSEGNGFKMGGEGLSVRHEIRQSISFGNEGNAFTSNSNPSLMVYNSTAIDQSGGGVGTIAITRGDTTTPIDGRATNCFTSSTGEYIASCSSTFPGGNYSSVLYSRTVNSRTLAADNPMPAKFLNRKPDGRPDLGNNYATTGPAGATAFYVTVKPEPNF